jgi:hypothetical protein
MALLHAERFGGHYDGNNVSAVSLAAHWEYANGTFTRSTTGGRDGGVVLSGNGNGAWLARRTWAPQFGVGVVGFVFFSGPVPTSASGYLISIVDSNNASYQLTLEYNAASGLLQAKVGGDQYWSAVVVTGITVIAPNRWYVVEFKFSVQDSGGLLECKCNGVLEFSVTRDTREGGAGGWSRVQWGGFGHPAYPFLFETAWVLNTDGPAPSNDYLGNAQAWPLKPNGPVSAQWTPSGSPPLANWENVDEVPKDNDSTYNESGTAGHIDRFTLEDIPSHLAGKEICGFTQCLAARQAGLGSASLREKTWTGASTLNGVTKVMAQAADYAEWCTSTYSAHPVTGVAFTEAEINALNIGYEKVL